MREKALLFGESKSLVGIVTDPASSSEGSDRPGVIVLNAGTLHRVGPNRLHVQIARTLASEGFVVLRFDHSGIGDSRPRDDNLPFARRAVRETQEAMDFLTASRGIQRFVLVGICSGADNALLASYRDPRVTGAVLIDGYNLPTLGLILHFYRKRLLSLRSWARLFVGRSEIWSGIKLLTALRLSSRATGGRRESILPSREELVQQLQTLTERGVQLYLLYSAESPAYYNYLKTLRRRVRAWSAQGRVKIEHLKDTDHVFTLLCNQQRLVDLIRSWVVGSEASSSGRPELRQDRDPASLLPARSGGGY